MHWLRHDPRNTVYQCGALTSTCLLCVHQDVMNVTCGKWCSNRAHEGRKISIYILAQLLKNIFRKPQRSDLHTAKRGMLRNHFRSLRVWQRAGPGKWIAVVRTCNYIQELCVWSPPLMKNRYRAGQKGHSRGKGRAAIVKCRQKNQRMTTEVP